MDLEIAGTMRREFADSIELFDPFPNSKIFQIFKLEAANKSNSKTLTVVIETSNLFSCRWPPMILRIVTISFALFLSLSLSCYKRNWFWQDNCEFLFSAKRLSGCDWRRRKRWRCQFERTKNWEIRDAPLAALLSQSRRRAWNSRSRRQVWTSLWIEKVNKR